MYNRLGGLFPRIHVCFSHRPKEGMAGTRAAPTKWGAVGPISPSRRCEILPDSLATRVNRRSGVCGRPGPRSVGATR